MKLPNALRLWGWSLLVFILTPVPVLAQGSVQPDCTILGPPNGTTVAGRSAVFDNRTSACTSWSLAYSTNGAASISIEVDEAPDIGGQAGTWVAFPNTASGTQPLTVATQSQITVFKFFPWVSVNLNSIAGGNVRYVLYGWRVGFSSDISSQPGGGTSVTITSGPTGASALQFQGTAAVGAAAVGNPSVIAGTDSSGNVRVPRMGLDPSIAGAYGFDVSQQEILLTAPIDATSASQYFFAGTFGAEVFQPTFPMIYNGATYDRLRSGGALGSIMVAGAVASGATNAGNPVKQGIVFNTTQPTVTNGQVVDAQSTARGAQIVATGVDAFTVTVGAALPTGGNTIGAVTGSGTFTVACTTGASACQVQGNAAADAAAVGNPVQVAGVNPAGNIEEFGLADTLTTAPVQTLNVGGQFLTTQATATNGQIIGNAMTARGAQIVGTGVDTFNVTVNAALPTGGNTIGAVTGSGNFNVIGTLTNNNAVPAANNVGVLPAIANASSTSVTNVEGDQTLLSIDLKGFTRVQLPQTGNTLADTISNTENVWTTNAGGNVYNETLPYRFNASTWDREFYCPVTKFVTGVAATTTQIVAAVASQKIRVCSVVIERNDVTGVATTLKFVEGTGSNCATGQTSLTANLFSSGATAVTADSPPVNLYFGSQGPLITNTAADALCVQTTGAASSFDVTITEAQY